MQYFIILAISSVLISLNEVDNHSEKHIEIIGGKGFENYQIGKSTVQEVIEKYGNTFEKKDHNRYSTELIYKELGLSFYYYPEESDTLIGIEFFHPFRGITDKGIILNESKMSEVEVAYDSLDWYISEPFLEWYSEYPGIEFAVPRDTTIAKYPLDEEFHKELRISKIVVLDNFDDFE